MPHLSISVVIPVLNDRVGLARCLESLVRQNTRKTFEVVVVDDGSTVDLEVVRKQYFDKLDLKWIRVSQNKGPATARNIGVKSSGGDLILFTDADCVPDEDWVENLTSPFSDPRVIGAKGIYRTEQRDLWARLAQLEFEERYECLASVDDIDFIDTYCGAYRRVDFMAVGGFDESFPKADNEDVDLSYRIKKRGGKYVFVPQAVVCHKHREGMAKYFSLKFGRGFWRMRVYRKHPAKAGKDTYTPWTLKTQMMLLGLLPLGILTPKNRRRWFMSWLVTCFPLTRIAWRKDFCLIPWLPLFAMVRGIAILFGMFSEIQDYHEKPY